MIELLLNGIGIKNKSKKQDLSDALSKIDNLHSISPATLHNKLQDGVSEQVKAALTKQLEATWVRNVCDTLTQGWVWELGVGSVRG